MGRDDLYITVPSFFRCPISLDVMKSPVSLCTGVTYDRASIQKWLDSGNNTCPATMQVLQSKEIVPNRTLQRLIEIWSESINANNRNDDCDGRNDAGIPSEDEVVSIVKSIGVNRRETNSVMKELSRIENFANESDENKEFLAKLDGFLPMLAEFLGDGVIATSPKENEIIEKVVVVLDSVAELGARNDMSSLILTGNPNCLSTLIVVLQRGSSVDSRVGSIRVLESVSNDAQSKVLVAEKEGLLTELVKLVSVETDLRLIEASLSLLRAVSVTKRVKSKLIQLKIITELKSLLTAKSNTSKTVTEKALKLLETVSSCKEGRVEMCRDTECVEAVAGKVLKVSSEATEYAVTILWSVCYLFRDQRAQEAVNRSNGLTKILLLMQSNCSPAVRQMAADLLKIFRVNSKSCLSCYDTKTTHIMPF